MADTKVKARTKRDVIRSLRQPKVAVMLMLGFSSGLPFHADRQHLGYWLRDEGTTLQAIGFLSWVGLAYSLKFLWAPIIDRVDAPCSGVWAVVAGGCCSHSCWSPPVCSGFGSRSRRMVLPRSACFALVVAFASSTQDIVVDAWRIEAASDSDELGLLSAAYQLGYRAALLITDAVILIVANHFGWPVSYMTMAVLMASAAPRAWPPSSPRARSASKPQPRRCERARSVDAIAGPFVEFFRVHGGPPS